MATTVVLVNGLPGAGKTTLAHALAARTGWPCLSKDVVKEALAAVVPEAVPAGRLGAVASDALWALAATLSGTVLVESWWFRPRDLGFARAGVLASGAATVVEVWCDVDPTVARQRYAARTRGAVHDDARRLAEDFDRWAAGAEPLGLGPVVRVGTHAPVDVGALADAVRAAAGE